MHGELVLNLLGNPVVMLDERPVTGFHSYKVQALLYYLAVVQRSQSRSVLANLFWGDVAEVHARRSLTSALSNLRRLLGDCLLTSLDSVEFRRDFPHQLDVALLETALDSQNVDLLRQAAELYQGEFLEGFYVRNSPEFEMWMARERAHLRERFMVGLDALASYDAAAGNLAQAIVWTRRMLHIEPWREEAHRNLIRYLGQDGQRGAALAQFEECRRVLTEELGVEPEAATLALVEQIRTRGLARSSDLHGNFEEGQVAYPAAVAPSQRPPHNLLLQLTPFVGRRRDVDEIISKVCDPACRLLTLVGPGGIGKTRLALHVASSLLDRADAYPRFLDGIYFVALAAVSNRTEMIEAIAQAVGFFYQSAEPPIDQLIAYLAEKKMLLILDNFEHLSDQFPFVSDLLRRSPALCVLVTTRESLNVHDAWVYALSGLACPPMPEDNPPIDKTAEDEAARKSAAVKYDAINFFNQCAQRAYIGFDLEESLDCVIRICHLVDGLPLAIELAISWLRAMTIVDIVAEIESGLDILVTRREDIAERHRSMRVVLEQSWQMLTAREQNMFKRLALFAGGFQRDAAKAVADAGLMDLAIFVEKSLLQMTPRGRYQIHELLRQFAAERLAAQPSEEAETKRRHGYYYLDYLAARTERMVSNEQPQALDEVAEEIENIRAAWLWASIEREIAALTLATESLYNFYWVRRRSMEGRELFAYTLAHLSESHRDSVTMQLRMNLLRKQGLFHYSLGDYDEAYQCLELSMELARALRLHHELAYALNVTATISGWRGDLKLALPQLQEALDLSLSLQDQRAMADNLQQLAQFTAHLGDYARASELVDKSLHIAQAIERPDLLAHAMHIRGAIYFYTGDYEEAERVHLETHSLFAQLEHKNGVALALSGLSSVAWAKGGAALATAKELCVNSLNISRALGHRLRMARQLVNLAYICCDMGELDRARSCAEEALALATALRSKLYQSFTFCCLGRIASESHEYASGKHHLRQATAIAAEAELLPLLLMGLIEYAALLIKESPHVDAPHATNQQAEALALLALAGAHPACWHLFQARAELLRAQLAAELDEERVRAATARALTLSPTAAAREIQP